LLAVAASATVVVVVHGERVSRSQRDHSDAALAIAAALPRTAPVWLTHDVQYGEPQLGKIVGFYGPPRLRTCRAACEEETTSGASIVAREHEAARVAESLGADVSARHGILVVLTRR
jgi:hypothetical protein